MSEGLRCLPNAFGGDIYTEDVAALTCDVCATEAEVAPDLEHPVLPPNLRDSYVLGGGRGG